MEHRFIKTFSKRTKLRQSMCDSVAAKWERLGLKEAPPKLWAMED